MPIEKIFVYNGDHTSPPCVQDAASFFTAYGVFGKPDVRLTTGLAENFSGIDPNKVALVIPGGAALKMSWTLQELAILPALLNAGAHYIGFCAGAYLALNAAIYANSYKVIDGSLELPQQMLLEGSGFSFKLSEEYCAVGPFYPDFNYYVDWQKQYHSAYTPAQFRDASKPYVTETIETLPAIIAREPNVEKKQGGVFLSGPHLEASVPNSSMMRFFSTREEGRILLSEEKLEALAKNREALQSEAVRLINGTFGYR